MPRSPTTLDPFTAVAEPKRRKMLGMLAGGERGVNAMAGVLGWPQPLVSKHLSILLEVGLVNVRREGRERIYRINGEKLKPIHEWVCTFERFWDHQLNRIKERAEEKAKTANPPSTRQNKEKE